MLLVVASTWLDVCDVSNSRAHWLRQSTGELLPCDGVPWRQPRSARLDSREALVSRSSESLFGHRMAWPEAELNSESTQRIKVSSVPRDVDLARQALSRCRHLSATEARWDSTLGVPVYGMPLSITASH